MSGVQALQGLRVLEATDTIAGAYCGKLLVDAWADVVRVEPQVGGSLRSLRFDGGAVPAGKDSALFQYLNASKGCVTGTPANLMEWAGDADVLIEDLPPGAMDIDRLRSAHPRLVVVSLSPFGRSGRWADRPASDFTLQALSGSLAGRGEPGRTPLRAGGYLAEWAAAAYAAVATAATCRLLPTGQQGAHIDVSILEAGARLYPTHLVGKSLGAPRPIRFFPVPAALPTSDDRVGIALQTAQHYEDFINLIGFDDTIGLRDQYERFRHRDVIWPVIEKWSRSHTAAEVIETLSTLRIPTAPVGDGKRLLGFEQCVKNQIFVDGPSGEFQQPRVFYHIGGAPPRPFGPPVRAAERGRQPVWAHERLASKPAMSATPATPHPLQGVRVADFTAFWAGPEATLLLAALGSDVTKIESTVRPDPLRASSVRRDDPRWWEFGATMRSVNRNKKGVTLDFRTPQGMELLRRLLAKADVIIENFTPRVLDDLGLTWDVIHELAPQAVLVRMPGFGLSGPWMHLRALAPTIEMVSGLASMTGYDAEHPQPPHGPGDPLAGIQAAFATLVGLAARDRAGTGVMVEMPMFEALLNVTAPTVLEYSAYGSLLQPTGNHDPNTVPQGVFPCAGDDRWLALTIQTDLQWQNLVAVPGLESLARPELVCLAGRKEHEQEIEDIIRQWTTDKDLDQVVEALLSRGIPAAPVLWATEIDTLDHAWDRGFIDETLHQLCGVTERHPNPPFRLTLNADPSNSGPWLSQPAPTLGQHNAEVLNELGVDDHELETLEANGVIGTWWTGA